MNTTVFRYQCRVTYAECAPGNHVYYACYLEFLEAARGEFFRHLGSPFLRWQEQNTLFPVIECHLQFKAPARYDDVLTVELWLTALDRVRLQFAYRILNDAGREILLASTSHACATSDEKLKRIPDELKQLLAPYWQQQTSE